MKNFLFVLSVVFFCSCGTPGECGGITVDYDKEKGSISYGGGETVMYKGALLNGTIVAEVYEQGMNLKKKTCFKDGLRNGPTDLYFFDGKLKSRYMYKDEKLDGPFEEYDRDGKLIVQGKYKNGTLLL